MLQPILPASTLLSQDPRISSRLRGGGGHDDRKNDGPNNAAARREKQNFNFFFSTGCHELDSHVLLLLGGEEGGGGGGGGGFEPGCVVGISSEEEDSIGLAVGLQVIARMLLLSSSSSSSSSTESEAKEGRRVSGKKAMIITTLSTTSLLPRLRLALVSEAKVLLQGQGQDGRRSSTGSAQVVVVDKAKIKGCLERVLVARVFDVEGLREVLRELEDGSSAPVVVESGTMTEQGRDESSTGKGALLPSLILITNTSHLLSTLFQSASSARNNNKPTGYGGSSSNSDRFSAHNAAVQLSDQIRSLSKRGLLVMMLNSTTTSTTISPTSTSSNSSSSLFGDDNKGPRQQPDLSIMRSIFNSPPPPPPLLGPQHGMEGGAAGYMAGVIGHATGAAPSRNFRPGVVSSHQYQNQAAAAAAAAAAASSKRNKPSYGMVFSQMLDLHLLCTKVPRGRARPGGGYGGYIWAVEVLLDELGVYEGLEVVMGAVGQGEEEGEGEGQGGQREEEKGRESRAKKGLTRRSREQRWGAVEIEEGSGRVVDAFR